MPGVAHDQLWFAQSSNDLVVSVIGEDQSITVAGWFASTDNQFGQISAGDSFTATAAAVDLLVQAMSAFSRRRSARRPCRPTWRTASPRPGDELAAQLAAPISPALEKA